MPRLTRPTPGASPPTWDFTERSAESRPAPMDGWRTPIPPFPTGSVPVPPLPEAPVGGVVIQRPGDDVRGSRPDLLVATWAPVDLGRGRAGARAYRPVPAGPRLDSRGSWRRTRPGAWRRLFAAATACARAHPTTLGTLFNATRNWCGGRHSRGNHAPSFGRDSRR